MPLASLRALVQTDLEATDKFISEELQSEIPLIAELVQYILQIGGKRIRPLVVLLSARSFSHLGLDHIALAAAIELIHTATLLHDDVVDNATLRRGQRTAHTIWGNEASVLVGDFLYSRAFQLIVKLQDLAVINIFSEATNLIAEGEVLQLTNCHNPDTTEDKYFEVIQRKTGKLFEVAAHLGAAITHQPPSFCAAMQQYGMHLGISYQLIDDALDYRASSNETGKNIGNDLKEGKPTLPLIYALRNCTQTERLLMRQAIVTGSADDLDKILTAIESTKAIEYTAIQARKHAQQACLALEIIPNSPYKSGLQELAQFVVERNG